MMRRAAIYLATLLLALAGGAVLSAAPAQAWSYCTGAPSAAGRLNLYAGQGYCGQWWSYRIPDNRPFCFELYNFQGAENGVAAYWNRSEITMRIHLLRGCEGSSKRILPNSSDPNLYDDGLYHNTSSILVLN